MKFPFLALPVLLALSVLSACSREKAEPAEKELPIISVGEVELFMELALTRDEQRRGLMFRDGIADDHGMLFVFSKPQRMSFWMKNVSFPLDIGYFTSDGVLREIYRMYPQDTESRKSKREDLLYVLEVRAGWFKANEVRPGAKLDLAALQRAIASR